MIHLRKSRKGIGTCTKLKILLEATEISKGIFLFYVQIVYEHFYKSRETWTTNLYAPITQFQQPSTFCHLCSQAGTLKVEPSTARAQILPVKYSFPWKHTPTRELMHRHHPKRNFQATWRNQLICPLDPCYSKCVTCSAASISPGSLLVMQTFRPHFKLTEPLFAF